MVDKTKFLMYNQKSESGPTQQDRYIKEEGFAMKIIPFNKHNIFHQYAAVGVGGVLIAVALFFYAPLAIATPVGAVLLAVASVFFQTTVTKPLPLDEPPIVRRFNDLRRWLERKTAPATKNPEEKGVFLRWVGWDFAEVYDWRGRLLGHRQIIDWNMTSDDPEYHPEEVKIIFTPAKPEEERRLPLIARLRTPGMKVF